MKRTVFVILIAAIFLFFSFDFVSSQSEENLVGVHFFYGSTCPHCKEAEKFLEGLRAKYPQLKIKSYEVFTNKENAQLLLNFLEARGEEKIVRVPAIFIGEKTIIGYQDDRTTGKMIEGVVKGELESGEKDQIISFPLIGKIDLSKLSLPVLTVTLAALDGLNPCAMWILLFLIALLINTRSRKRVWLIGGTFILASGIVYYLLLAAWLNLFFAISYVNLTRIIIGIFALGVGMWQIKNFVSYHPGVCKVLGIKSRIEEKLKKRAEKIVGSPITLAMIGGLVILAFGVNIVEFFCSAGLPALYTRVLALSQLNSLAYYLYLLFYTFIFMLDDLLVFSIAIITLSRVGFTEKYNYWATLIGGLLIFILGILLIFKPEFLVFG